MNKSVEATGKTVEEAIDAAIQLAGLNLGSDVEVEVLDSGNKGFFGIGGKSAKVRVTFSLPDSPEDAPARVKAEKERPVAASGKTADKPAERKQAPAADKPAERKPLAPVNKPAKEITAPSPISGSSADKAAEQAQAFLQGIFVKLRVSPLCRVSEEDGSLLLSYTGKDLGILIGRHGETLNALQYLVNLVVNRKADESPRIVLDIENYRKGRERTLAALAKRMADKAVQTGRRVELEPMNPYERRIVHMTLQEDPRVETMSQGVEPRRQVVIQKKRSQEKNTRPR
ncbi:MAG: Jag N-terminal domain-containing protein [Clostridiales bacterium]|nr:Jag N-terminal domain-containing protein [Clostridiales bacterium]